MAVLNNILAGAAGQTGGAGGYQIERSLRFNNDDSARLSRVFSSSGNQKTWTWSAWVKFSSNERKVLFSQVTNFSNQFFIIEHINDGLEIYDYNVAYKSNLETANLFRDYSAWYHIVFTYDTTNTTADDRQRLYINGEQITTFSARTNPQLNHEGYVNKAGGHYLGDYNIFSPVPHDGYFADVHFVDGQSLQASDFGEFDDNGVWQPIEYAGTYGTNGFHLDFSDATNTTTIAEDSSGNGNDWSAQNISVTAGAGNDSLFDSPTNGTQTDTGAGGEVSGNYCTLNSAISATYQASNGGLDITSSSNWVMGFGTMVIPSYGKWYYEVVAGGENTVAGITDATGPTSPTNFITFVAISYVYYFANGYKYEGPNHTYTAYGATGTTGDVMGVAIDMDAGTLTFYKNGTSQGTAFTGLTGSYIPVVGAFINTQVVNFGQRAFAYSAPSGFKALCTANLDDPTIADGSTAMDVVTYTGNGTSQTISGLNFSPDFTWIKDRSQVELHSLYDTIRGATNRIVTNSTAQESSNNNSLTAFTSDGFSVGGLDAVNASGSALVAWNWDAGTSTVSNTDGSITANVRANASTGFSIVSYTGTSANATVGHGLNAAPEFIVIKNRDRAIDWAVYHAALGATQNLKLNRNYTAQSVSSYFNDTDPTSSVVSLGAAVATNYTGEDIIAYCFAPVEGYSAFGSYTGNGSTDGPFVYTGFRPRWILVKGADGPNTYNWFVQDTKRNPENLTTQYLIPNLSNVEGSTGKLDILSNGFKWRTSSTGLNESGTDYIYAAFAENPFKTARAR